MRRCYEGWASFLERELNEDSRGARHLQLIRILAPQRPAWFVERFCWSLGASAIWKSHESDDASIGREGFARRQSASRGQESIEISTGPTQWDSGAGDWQGIRARRSGRGLFDLRVCHSSRPRAPYS